MELLRNVALMVIDNGICDELDKDIFTDIKPKEIDNIVVLTEYKGSKVAQFTNTNVRSVQIIARDKRNMAARDKLWKIYDLLHSNDNIIRIGNKLTLVAIRHTPIKLGIDEKNRHEWVMNIGITYDNTQRR